MIFQEVSATALLGFGIGLSQFNQIAIGVTDTVMMGRFGSEALAAGSLVNSLELLLFLFFMGVLQATAPLMGTALGESRNEDLTRIFNHGIILACVMAVPMIIIAIFMKPCLILLGQQADVIEIAQSYARYLVPGFLPSLLFIILRVFLTTVESVILLVSVSLIGVFVNACGNFIFMFGMFGIPPFGVAGSAVSTSLTNFLMVVILFFMIYIHANDKFNFFSRKNLEISLPLFFSIISLGIPIGFVIVSEYAIFAVAGLVFGRISANDLAAFSLALQWLSIFYMLPVGFSHAATTRVALAVGQKDIYRITLCCFISIGLILIYGCFSLFFIYLFDEQLVRLISSREIDQNLIFIERSKLFMKWMSIVQLINGIIVVCAGILRGFRDTQTPMFLVFFCYWFIGVGSVVILGIAFGSLGVLIGVMFSFSLTLLGIFISLIHQIYELPKIVSQISIQDKKLFFDALN
ncbi:MAG: MATE family efflux transporter [Microcystis sp. M53BS1]|nr:MATE family efflux transporter [Microcystis sp. M53BS1]MCA2564906.1 MATE family efflux transporter [Microcystis sp. M40BS1]MCA2604895.1 MATE family efflux transporter [Microcystis sp. M26BS1]